MKKSQKSLIKSGDFQLNVLSIVDKCQMDECRAAHVCGYHLEQDMTDRKCLVMHWYMQQAEKNLFRHARRMGQTRTFQVGMHILPLYRSLCKLQIAEAGVRDVVYLNTRGEPCVNQIHKHLAHMHDSILKSWGRIFRANLPQRPSAPVIVPNFKPPTTAPGKRKVKTA